MSAWELWLYLVLVPNLAMHMQFLCLVVGLATVFAAISRAIADDQSAEIEAHSSLAGSDRGDSQPDYCQHRFFLFGQRLSTLVAVFIAVLALQTAIPSPRQMYMLIGGYAATNIEGVEQLPANVVRAANAFLERVAEEAER